MKLTGRSLRVFLTFCGGAAIFFIPIVFFSQYRNGAFTVDDPGLITFLGDTTTPTWEKIFRNTAANRWRPIADIGYVLVYDIAGKSFLVWSLASVFLLGLTGLTLQTIIRKLGASWWVALLLPTVLVTSRFVHYQVMTATGLMEALALLLFALLVLVGVQTALRPTHLNVSMMAFVFLLLILVHERFQSLVLALLLLIWLMGGMPIVVRGAWSVLLCVPPFFLFAVKQLYFGMPFFVGVGSATDMGFTGASTSQHLSQFFLHLLGINVGDPWFSGLIAGNQPASTLILAVVGMLIFCCLVVASLHLPESGQWIPRTNNAKLLLVGSCTIFCLMIPAVSTSRLELRWMSTSYLLLLAVFAGITNQRLKKGVTKGATAHVAFVVMILLGISMNVRYRENANSIFFRASQPGTLVTLKVLEPAYKQASELGQTVYVIDSQQRADFWKGLNTLVSVHSDVEIPTVIQLITRDQVPSEVTNPVIVLVAEDGSVSRSS